MWNRRSTWILAFLLVGSLVSIAAPTAGQSFYGSLISVVGDAQGGVIPGATVVLTNTATTERREGVSGEDGTLRFVNLVPGTYRLEVELAGFQRFVRDGIAVNVQ
ncbi:MAG: carboxypeptidase regulatory-like domain-containing protein, partial [Acidobacteria bacterium]